MAVRIGSKYKLDSGETGVVMAIAAHSPETWLGYHSMKEFVARHRQLKLTVAVERGDKIQPETVYIDRST